MSAPPWAVESAPPTFVFARRDLASLPPLPSAEPGATGTAGADSTASNPDTLANRVAAEMAVARQAQGRWATTPLAARLAWVKRLRHGLAAAGPRLASVMAAAAGPAARPAAETLAAEVVPLADACRFLEREAAALLAPRRLGGDGRPAWLRQVELELRREALGVVLVLAPANYPLLLPAVQATQALAAGNAVLLKPGRGGGAAAKAFRDLALEAGLDPALLAVLPDSAAAGSAAAAARPDKVLLTGSAASGRLLLRALAADLVPAVLELSGADALYVLPGADLDRVAAAIRFGLAWNGGATCIAPRRLFVPSALADALEERLAPLVATLPLVALPADIAAIAHARVAEALFNGARRIPCRAAAQGAKGQAVDEEWELFRPTVLAVERGARGTMELLRDGLVAPLAPMAPIVALVRVDNDDEALALAERCPQALGVSIFGPPAAALELAGRVRAGVVTINDVIVPTADPRLPFGGRGDSGYGVTRGAQGLLELTALKTVAVRRGLFLPHLEPSAPGDATMFAAYLQAAHGGGLRRRLAGGGALLAALWRRGRARQDSP